MRQDLFFITLALSFIVLLPACHSGNKIPFRDDPLIGKLFKADTAEEIHMDQLINEVRGAHVIYLSEKHDNPYHHRLQLEFLEKLVSSGKKPSLAFEFFARNDTSTLLNYMDSGKINHSPKVEKQIEKIIRRKLGWDSRTDRMWNYYSSLLKFARSRNLKSFGLDIPSSLNRRITRNGVSVLTPLELSQVEDTKLESKVYQEYMYGLFAKVHCGMNSEKMQKKLYATWKIRNDTMAGSIVLAHKDNPLEPVVVIMGGGHTEFGLGVVDRVSHMNEKIRQVNIGFREISREPRPLSEYLAPLNLKGFPPNPPYDYIMFSQRVSYKNPCDEFKKMLDHMKKNIKKPE